MLLLNESFYELIDLIENNDNEYTINPNRWIRTGFNNLEVCNAYLKNFALNLNLSKSVKRSLELIKVKAKSIRNIDKILVSSINCLLVEEIPDIRKQDININFFIGCGTCNAFPYVSNEGSSINIALEKLVENNNINNSILDLIIHEGIHIFRILNGRYRSRTVGDLIIEEGISCYCHKLILGLKDTEDYRVFPIELTNIDILELEQASKKLLSKLDSSDLRIVYYGDDELRAGLSYIVGYNIVLDFMTKKNHDLKFLIEKLECEYVEEYIGRGIN